MQIHANTVAATRSAALLGICTRNICRCLNYALEHLIVRSQDMSEVGIAISMGVGDSGTQGLSEYPSQFFLSDKYSLEIPILRCHMSDVLSTAQNHVIALLECSV